MIPLNENASLKLIVDKKVKPLSQCAGNTLAVDKTFRQLSGINIQQRVKKDRHTLLPKLYHQGI